MFVLRATLCVYEVEEMLMHRNGIWMTLVMALVLKLGMVLKFVCFKKQDKLSSIEHQCHCAAPHFWKPALNLFPCSTFPLRAPFAYGNFSSSVPQCFGFYEERNQRQEVILSPLDEDYHFRPYSEERLCENQHVCGSPEIVSSQSICSEERVLSPLPQLDVEVVEEVLPSPPSTPSSTYIVNVTDSDEEEEVKFFQVL